MSLVRCDPLCKLPRSFGTKGFVPKKAMCLKAILTGAHCQTNGM